MTDADDRRERALRQGREYAKRRYDSMSVEERRAAAHLRYLKRTPEQMATYRKRDLKRTKDVRRAASRQVGGDPAIEGVMVMSRSGKVHVMCVAHPAYKVQILGPTYCGRDLASYTHNVDLDTVTTDQVCRLCIRHLPTEES